MFRARVANQNMANAITVRNLLHLGPAVFSLHPSMAHAAEAAAKLPIEVDEALNGQLPLIPVGTKCDKASGALCRHGAPSVKHSKGTSAVLTSSANCTARQIRSYRVPAARPLPPLLPLPSLDTSKPVLPGSELPQARVTSAFTPTSTPSAKPYLQALLTPAHPQIQKPRRMPPISTTSGCFRCLSTDHFVRDCRDPIRCHNCRGSDHRQRDCKMPAIHSQTPMIHRRNPVPTVIAATNPTSHHTSPPPPSATSPPKAATATAITAASVASTTHHQCMVTFGSLQIETLLTWPRAEQLDAHGQLRPFFAPPTPPPPQQLAPSTNPANQNPQTIVPQSPLAPAQGPAAPPSALAPAPHAALATPYQLLIHLIEPIHQYPLPPLPRLPIVIITRIASTHAHPLRPAAVPLALTWHASEPMHGHTDDAPPPAPVTAPTLCVRPRGARKVLLPQRHSVRLAAKEQPNYVDMTDKASQLKALHNTLAGCSKELKLHVTKKGLMGKKKKPIPSADLRKMANAVGLDAMAVRALDKVTTNKDD